MFMLPTSADAEKGGQTTSPRSSNFAWFYTAALLLYFVLTYSFLGNYVDLSQKLFDGLDVNLPLPTRFLLANQIWLFPALLLCGSGAAAVKLIMPLDKMRRWIVNVILVGAGILGPTLIVFITYLPLFTLIGKLQSAK